ncbi:MAG: AraC family transcriptional regulator, partial [Bacteroidota bacterium]
SRVPHCWKNHPNPAAQAISTVIQWNPDMFQRVPELSGVFDLLQRAGRGLVFTPQEVAPLLPEILDLPQQVPSIQYVQLLQVLIQLAECSARPLSQARFLHDLPNEYQSRMELIQNYLEAKVQEKIYLKEVADLVNLSEPAFCRFFQKMMGRSFFTFVNEYRINQASRMLIDTDWPVSEIAFACGYESLPHFHKQFKRIHESSPAKYRKGFRRA